VVLKERKYLSHIAMFPAIFQCLLAVVQLDFVIVMETECLTTMAMTRDLTAKR